MNLNFFAKEPIGLVLFSFLFDEREVTNHDLSFSSTIRLINVIRGTNTVKFCLSGFVVVVTVDSGAQKVKLNKKSY